MDVDKTIDVNKTIDKFMETKKKLTYLFKDPHHVYLTINQHMLIFSISISNVSDKLELINKIMFNKISNINNSKQIEQSTDMNTYMYKLYNDIKDEFEIKNENKFKQCLILAFSELNQDVVKPRISEILLSISILEEAPQLITHPTNEKNILDEADTLIKEAQELITPYNNSQGNEQNTHNEENTLKIPPTNEENILDEEHTNNEEKTLTTHPTNEENILDEADTLIKEAQNLINPYNNSQGSEEHMKQMYTQSIINRSTIIN